MKLLSVIKNIVLSEQQSRMGFINVFPTIDTLTDRTKMGYNPIGGTNNTNIIYLTRRGEDGKVIPNSKFTYKLSGSYGFIDFGIKLRNVVRNRSNGKLSGEVMPTNKTVAGIMKKLIPSHALTEDGWLEIEVPVDKLNTALTQLHNNNGSSAEIKVGSGVEINLTKV